MEIIINFDCFVKIKMLKNMNLWKGKAEAVINFIFLFLVKLSTIN